MARIRVSLRHQIVGSDDSLLQCGDLVIDLSKHQVFVANNQIKLTPTEYELLKVLAKNAGKVMTHSQLLKLVWGLESADNQYIRVYIAQLRRKIEKNPSQPCYIITESGIGYRLIYR